MVGETAELQDEIDELHIEINESKENLNELVKSRISLTENIKETEENLRSGLSEEGGWRDRERKITGKSSTITSATISALKKGYTRISPADKESLSRKIEQITASIVRARDRPRITAKVEKVTNLPTTDQLTSFFNASPLSTTGNELSGRIGQVFEDPKYSHLVSISRATIWGSEESDFYPYCFQDIEESYKNGLSKHLRSSLTRK